MWVMRINKPISKGPGEFANSTKRHELDYEWDFLGLKVLLSDKLKIADKRFSGENKIMDVHRNF